MFSIWLRIFACRAAMKPFPVERESALAYGITRGSNKSPVPDRVADLLATTPPFEWLSDELRGELIANLLVEYFEADEPIRLHDEGNDGFLYIVESGCVRLVDTESGRLIDLCGEGDTLGAELLLNDGVSLHRAVAAEPTVCAMLPATTFRTLCDANSDFADFFRENLEPDVRVDQVVDAVGERLLFGTKVSTLIIRKLVTCRPDTTVREAALMMRNEAANSILVLREHDAVGIVTDSDLRNQVIAEGASHDTPVSKIMSAPLITIGSGSLIFEALMMMSRHGVHHLVVSRDSDEEGPPAGVLSEQDIAHAGGRSPASTLKRIEKALSLGELAHIRTHSDRQLLRLFHQGVKPEDIMEVVTEVNDRVTIRLLQLAEENLIARHPEQAVDLKWTWLTLGSKGRREMGLSGDQDNAILYEDPADPTAIERADRWFKTLAQRVNLGLAECGFPFCRGGVMAVNEKWRQPLSKWKQIFRTWILEPEPAALMHATVFFDLRALYGDVSLADELKADLCGALRQERGFLAFLAHNAVSNRPPLSFFRHFVVERSGEYRDTFNIKLHGLAPLVDIARILALESGFLASTNTLARFAHAGKHLGDAKELTANAADAFSYLLDLRLRHHLEAVEARTKPNDHIHPASLSKTQQKVLRAVFSAMEEMQVNLTYRYGAQMMRN